MELFSLKAALASFRKELQSIVINRGFLQIYRNNLEVSSLIFYCHDNCCIAFYNEFKWTSDEIIIIIMNNVYICVIQHDAIHYDSCIYKVAEKFWWKFRAFRLQTLCQSCQKRSSLRLPKNNECDIWYEALTLLFYLYELHTLVPFITSWMKLFLFFAMNVTFDYTFGGAPEKYKHFLSLAVNFCEHQIIFVSSWCLQHRKSKLHERKCCIFKHTAVKQLVPSKRSSFTDIFAFRECIVVSASTALIDNWMKHRGK